MSIPSADSFSSTTVSDVFVPNCDILGPNFFDDYLKVNSSTNAEHTYSDLSNSNSHRRASGNHGFVDKPLNSQDDNIENRIQKDETEIEMWTQHLTTSQGNTIYQESTWKATLSETEIPSLESITLDSPQTPTRFPSSFSQSSYDTATFLRRPSGISDTPSKSLKTCSGSSLRNPIRKANSFPKMIRHSHRSNSDLCGHKDQSARLNVNFHGQTGTLSSPPSLEGFHQPGGSKLGGARNENLPYINGIAQGFSSSVFKFETPLSTEVSDIQSGRDAKCQASDNVVFSPTSRSNYASSRWSPLPSSSSLSTSSIPLSFPSESDSPIWWNHATSVPMAQPSPTAICNNPKRATRSVALQLQDKVSHTMNVLPFYPTNATSGAEFSPDDYFSIESSIADQFISTQPQPQCLAPLKQSVSDMPPRRPRLIRKPRFGQSESDPPSPIPSPELQARKRKTSKQSKQSLPQSPSLGVSVDFVNYTPDDSQKILTGVAPSGSSKTKARREKEALEKRRKLSQAAVRAVRAAGGDVAVLAEEGLLV
jgi:hypothetical protein